MVCFLLEYSNCPIEQQRFAALDEWATRTPLLHANGKSLSTYFNGLLRNVSSYKPEFILSTTSILIRRGNYSLVSFRNQFGARISINSTNSSLSLIRSQFLTITSQTSRSFSAFTIILYLNNTLPSKSVYNISANENQKTINNGYLFFLN